MAIVKRGGRTRAKQQQAPAKVNNGLGAGAGAGGGIQKAEFDITKKKEVGVSDLTLLSKITDEAINENLHKRFMNDTIYTYIGHVLISVNPFRDLGIYTLENLNKYKGRNRLEVPPHVFAIAESMYYHLKSYGENQCVIISGESGAGKTEAAKQIMQYIANVSVDSGNAEISKIKDMVLATNPLLESFGCAKTLRNNNSSRHGKYLEIKFSEGSYQPIAAHITNYLLEKQRVVSQITNERNFHIFYQFTKHCPPQYQQQFGIQGPETYVYTSAAKCITVDGIDDGKDFKDTLNAMNIIGLSQAEQDNIFRILALILWTGNISFVEDESGNAAIRDDSVTNFVAYLLDVNAEILKKAITERTIETSHGMKRGSTYHVPLNIVQATAVRDALAKGLYNNLFDWIVERVNLSLQGNQGQSEKSIGILDIYGFEIFEHNSFEQICINYVNEKLQQIFIQLTLKAEQDEYVQEQIKWTPIDYFNNKVVCDLIEATRPQPGLFAALNDSIKTAHADSDAADQVFAQRLSMVGASNRHFEDRRGKFIIKHYAGDVTYDVAGMTDKNKDAMLRDLLELLGTSSNAFVTQTLFPPNLLSELVDSKKRPETASDKIKKSANILVDTLSQATPSYIRTIKPNQTKKPRDYDNQQVLHQIKYLGLKENVRIRRAGFAYRSTFQRFVQRFYLLSPATGYAGDYIWQGDDLTAVKEILRACHIPTSEYQLGTTKVFIKTPETLFALEDMRDKYWHNMAARIQRAWRRYIKRKEDAAKTIQRAWRMKNHGNQFEQFRDYGNSLLQGRKERRRFSMLGSRAYMGDYLACNDKTGFGRFVVNQVGIKEPVVFSAKGVILLSKFGRSSKRFPRIFVLTKSNLYIIAEVLVEKRLQLQREFALPVHLIKSVGLSQLQDNWVAVCLLSPTTTTPDVFINLDFKTELVAQLKKLNSGLSILIGPTVQYQKKPGKYQTVKFAIGSGPHIPPLIDSYKSGTVTVNQGLPPTSKNPKRPRAKLGKVDYSKYYNRGVRSLAQPAFQSQPTASYRSEPAYPQPTTQLYATQHQPQQPQVPTRTASRKAPPPAPSTQTAAQVSTLPQAARKPAAPARPAKKIAPQPPVKKAVSPQPPAKKTVAAPPPPPPPPALSKPKHPTYRAMYDYDGSVAGSVPLVKDTIYYVLQINGKWGLVKTMDETQEGWSPIDYLQEESSPSASAATQSYAPTTASSNPVSTASSNTYTNTTQATTMLNGSLGNGLADALKAKKSEETTLAGSLADALKKRQGVTRDDSDAEDDDDDDDW
ncbi:myosin-5 [Lodderomyces elongisporus NRRL YB-4239]|uniref:Myosin-1 n=1 Tax=Lodderomyces elongisporus (strain ATCC 11503 / CBS 2605 / JCM 1781 / NBRC 1676 / NRRL YB-4239) TaxID=379508 RepID=MYO1_LODEL|nr:RecName: Full=Myosin-1; AltName: Full=Class I unconventional myosin; AltName: Full=Type I myosin [Lodderomyces elongisporus NRRL YB-4239]EDK46266.1 myosin-5 [Lodderomyces elongisporus NRRL YB-4239]